MRIFRYSAFVGIVCVMAACATPMRTPAMPHINAQVTTFHQFPVTIAGMKFAVMPAGDQVASLEFATYSTQIRLALTNAGLIETEMSDADIAVAFAYTIDSGKQFTIDTPTYGQTGISNAATNGTVDDAGRYTATTTYTPTYGITGYRSSPIRMYTRQIIIRIADNKKSGNGIVKYMYQADVVSAGTGNNLALIVPRMIDAVFAEFPAGNGTVRKLSIPCPACDRS